MPRGLSREGGAVKPEKCGCKTHQQTANSDLGKESAGLWVSALRSSASHPGTRNKAHVQTDHPNHSDFQAVCTKCNKLTGKARLRAPFLLPNPFCSPGSRQPASTFPGMQLWQRTSSFALALCSGFLSLVHWWGHTAGRLPRNWARSVLEYLVIFTSLQLHLKTKILCIVLPFFFHKTFTFSFLFKITPTVAHSSKPSAVLKSCRSL